MRTKNRTAGRISMWIVLFLGLNILCFFPKQLNARQYLQKVVETHPTETGMELVAETERETRIYLWVESVQEDVFRVRISTEDQFDTPALTQVGIINDIHEQSDISVAEDGEFIRVRSPGMQVVIQKDPFKLDFLNAEGRELLSSKSKGIAFNEQASIHTEWDMREDEHFYGFGEKFNSLDQRSNEVPIWVVDVDDYFGERSNIPIPFYMSTEGFGVFLNTTYRTVFHMGDMGSDDFIYPSYSFENENNQLELYVFNGPSFKEILGDYTALTGRAPLPPKYALGHWHVSNHQQDEWMERAKTLREREFPVDIIDNDIRWVLDNENKYGATSMEWNRDKFPNPEKMLQEMEEMNIKFGLWEVNLIETNVSLFDEAKEKGYFVENYAGDVYLQDQWRTEKKEAVIDFSSPETVEWWRNIHKDLIEQGVDHFKLDHGEEAPEDGIYHNGMSGAQMHNLYPVLYLRTVYEAVQDYTDIRGIIRTRTGYVGTQRYPQIWPADQEQEWGYPPYEKTSSYATQVKALLSLGLSGFTHWDFGFGTWEVEPMSRGIQIGTFSPMQEMFNRFFLMNDRAFEIAKKYVQLRYRLLPYIYSYDYEAYTTGVPIARAMVLEYQNDPAVYDRDLQYMFGEEFLVAPIYRPSDNPDTTVTREIYLPEGRWTDFWTEKEYAGNQTIEYTAEMEWLPLFVKQGSIVPLGPKRQHTGEPLDTLTLHVYPGPGVSSFTLYQDDGRSMKYQQGEYTLTEFSSVMEAGNLNVTLGAAEGGYTGQLSERAYLTVIHDVTKPESINIDGSQLREVPSPQQVRNTSGTWIYETDSGILRINSGSKASDVEQVIRVNGLSKR